MSAPAQMPEHQIEIFITFGNVSAMELTITCLPGVGNYNDGIKLVAVIDYRMLLCNIKLQTK
jgi:hypothetical protein